MPRWLLVGLVLALGCGGKARVGPRPGAVWLAGIRVEGNRSVDDDELIPKLALRRAVDTGRPVDPHQLALDAGRIRAIYLRLGFFDVQVKERVDERGGAQTAVFAVVEGRRATMEVVIKGLPPEVPEARARALIGIPDGGWFDYEAYDDVRLPLQTLVERAGYAHVQLEAYVSAERTKARAVAIYEVSPGPRCTFGAAAIEGAAGPLAEAIAHRVAFREGDVYSPDALAATQRGLYELGRFSTVVVAPQRVPGETVIPVKITVALGSRHEVRLGGGFGLDSETYEARVRAGFSYVPLGSPLWTLAADARVAATVLREGRELEPKIRAIVSAQRIDLLRPRLGGEAAVGYDFLAVEAYTSTGPQLRLGLSSPLGARWLTARVGWAFSYLVFPEIHPVIKGTDSEASLGLDAPQRLGVFQAALAADLRDNPLDPKSGMYLALRGQIGTAAAGGAFTFTQVTPDLRGYIALGTPRLVLAARLRAGAILAAGSGAPVTERYFSGGAQSHRGFAERRLSPALARVQDGDTDSVPTGGGALLEAGVELRLRIGSVWSIPYGVTAFVDGGDVWGDPYKAAPLDLHWAAGGGLSLQVAGVKVRLDVGHRLNRKGTDEPQYGKNTAVHLGVGDSF